MLNIIDLLVVGFVLFYLLRNAGGLIKTIKNLVVVIIVIIFFGAGVRLLLNTSFISGDARQTIANAYFVRLSYAMIAGGYPVISNSAPKVDSFIKDNIISTPEAKTELPRPEQFLPKVALPKQLDNK